MRISAFFILFTIMLNNSSAQVNTESGFLKGAGASEYKIYPSLNGTKLKYGNYLKVHSLQIYKATTDSVLYDSKDYTSAILPIDSVNMPEYIYKVIKDAEYYDSIVFRMLVDSVYKEVNQPLPPFFTSGSYLYTIIKIEEVYETKAAAEKEMARASRELAVKDSLNMAASFNRENKILKEYFLKNSIKPFKAPKGTYINIVKKGIGKNATVKDVVKLKYTGKTFAGKVFDSNTDKTFGHLEPYEVNMSFKNTVITGWEEGLLYLNKGCKAVLYIPSPLGFGSRGAGADIGPDEILIFDIEIISIRPSIPVKKSPAKPIKVIAKPKPKPRNTGK